MGNNYNLSGICVDIGFFVGEFKAVKVILRLSGREAVDICAVVRV
jgi:hypothetical protein